MFIDNEGKKVFVTKQGSNFMTARVGEFGKHRIKSPVLPIRETYEEAQYDLIVYAEKKGWKYDY